MGQQCLGTMRTDILVFMYRSLYVDIQKKCVGKIHVDNIISISINNHEEVHNQYNTLVNTLYNNLNIVLESSL